MSINNQKSKCSNWIFCTWILYQNSGWILAMKVLRIDSLIQLIYLFSAQRDLSFDIYSFDIYFPYFFGLRKHVNTHLAALFN